jgi:hypothetical protein
MEEKVKFLLVALSFLSLLVGCAGSPTPIPEAKSSAALLYRERCTTCHSIPHPKRHRYGEWKVIVEVMETHMKERQFPPLTDEERLSILGYLESHSR